MKARYSFLLLLCPMFCLAQITTDDTFLPDCVLPPSVYQSEKGFGTNADDRHWPGQIIPYEIQIQSASQVQDIDSAIQMLNNRTNVCILPRGNQEAYLKIESNNDGSNVSFAYSIGYTGEEGHLIRLSPVADRSIIIHEFNHILGLFHEHQRPDRDDFIEINWSNINANFLYAFAEINENQTYRTYFDFQSNMLYPANAFSRTGGPTIVYPNSNTPIPNERLELGTFDINTINSLYPEEVNCDSIYAENVIDVDMRFSIASEGVDYCVGIPVMLEGIPIGHDGVGWSWEWIVADGELSDPSEQRTEVIFADAGEYKIKLRVRNHYMEKTIERRLSIIDPRAALDIFPNPVSQGAATVQLTVTSPKMQLGVFDALGRKMYATIIESSACVERLPLQISHWPKGPYYLWLDDGQQQLKQRFVVQ